MANVFDQLLIGAKDAVLDLLLVQMEAVLNKSQDVLNMEFLAIAKNVLVCSFLPMANVSSQIVNNMEQLAAKHVEFPSLSNKVFVDSKTVKFTMNYGLSAEFVNQATTFKNLSACSMTLNAKTTKKQKHPLKSVLSAMLDISSMKKINAKEKYQVAFINMENVSLVPIHSKKLKISA